MRQRLPEDIPADVAELIRFGTVIAVDLVEARCQVRYGDPDDDQGGAVTAMIRWLAPRAGMTRVWSPPSVGEQVLLLAPDGQIGNAVALTGIVQDAFPAAGNSLAELISFSDGAQIRYDPESHALAAILPAGGTAQIDAQGGITLRGDVTIEGNVAMTGTLTAAEDVLADGDVKAGAISLKNHKHSGVQAGGAQTGTPV